jgi:holliday junction DNA helicase RuvA
MIGFLKGRLAVKQPPMLLVDVNGVGYELEAPMSTFYALPAVGEPVALYTHLVIRDDAHVLFGFGTDGERRLFRGLLKVSGVGPKIALGILSGASVEDFLRTIEAEDVRVSPRRERPTVRSLRWDTSRRRRPGCCRPRTNPGCRPLKSFDAR